MSSGESDDETPIIPCSSFASMILPKNKHIPSSGKIPINVKTPSKVKGKSSKKVQLPRFKVDWKDGLWRF